MSEARKQKEAKIARAYHRKTENINFTIDGVPTGDEVISGEDDRKDYYDVDETQRQLADATVILTDSTDLTRQDDGSYELDVDPFRRRNLPPCSGERFGNQHTGGWCSGFMVGSDLIVTAGHCGRTESDIQNTGYVFGFRVGSEDDPGTTTFAANQVYFGRELIAHDLSSAADFAVVRLDREITAPGAVALPVRTGGVASVGSNVGVVGYPSGLPVKIAFGEETVVARRDEHWLFANLDTYGGNSGSAVLNSDGLVEGILVRGAQDYVIDNGNACFRSNVIANSDGSEAITRASSFVGLIP